MAEDYVIEMLHITKEFPGIKANDDITLQLRKGEVHALLGENGAGKSTLLRLLAGLEKQTSGEILIDGRPFSGPSLSRGVVFQDYGLFPWMTAGENIMLALRQRFPERDKKELREVAVNMLQSVGLDKGVYNKLPKELSGGMKQRCAIARAFGIDPPILLMDEPFGALDAQTRTQLQTELLETWEREKKTCFFITHDVEEAIILAQRVIIMSARPGRIKDIVDVNIPYPRTQETKLTPEFNELKNHIWSQVYQEYLAVRK